MKLMFNGEPVIGRPYRQISSISSNQFLIKLIVSTVFFQFFINLSNSLRILPKPCNDVFGNQGTCMFVWQCIKTEGRHLGTCVDGFLFGSCCAHNETLNQLDSGSSTPAKPYYSNSISAAYHSEHEYTTTNLELIHNNPTNLTSYVNFNNNPPNENDVYHIHHESSSSPVQSMLSTISSIPSINLSFMPASNSQFGTSSSTIPSTTSSLSSNYHNLNHHHSHFNHHNRPSSNNFNSLSNSLDDDHRRPHTHNHSNHSGTHSHHHNYENFATNINSDKQSASSSQQSLTTIKPSIHSFINFNLTNHHNQHLISNSKPPYKPINNFQQSYSTTILPPIVMNYNPFKPTNHTYSISNKHNSTLFNNKPNNNSSSSLVSNTNLVRPTHSSTWNSFYKPWAIHTFTTKPTNNFLQTFRPPLFNIFRPHTSSIVNSENQSNQPTSSSMTNHNLNSFYNKPTLKPPIVRPTVSSFGSNNMPYYSTRTTPFLSNTQSMNYQQFPITQSSLITTSTTTTTEQPFLISPNVDSSNNSSIFHEIKPLPSSYQNYTNASYLTNESSSVLVTNGNGLNSGESSQLQSASNSPESRAYCGSPKVMPNTKVVGGRSARFGQWPWQVSVRRTSFFGFSSTHRCGGAIVSQTFILTAAHCVDDLLMSQIRIRVGEYDFASVLEPYPYQERTVRRKIVHPQYNFFTYENDLALVELEEPIIFQPHISPICLPEESVQLLGRNATVTGWGRLSEGGILPSVLQEVRVPIVSNEKCKNMFLNAGRHEYIPDVFLCAGFENGGHDSCQGDSGGPLSVKGDDGRWFLAGIISWGIGCAEANLPGVCTRISKFVSWINQTMKN